MKKWTFVKLAVGLSVLLFVMIFILLGFNETATREAIRWSARISFTLFCAAFVASSLHDWRKNRFTIWLLSNRKYIGISFGIVHLLHLKFLWTLQHFFHPVFDLAATTSLLAGGIAYFFVVAMLLTSFQTFARYLSARQWKILHTVGGYWIWGIFMSSYAKRSLTGYEHIPLVLILLGVLVLKIRYLLKNKIKNGAIV